MCGFIGFVSDINNKQMPLIEEKFEHYLNELKNRGPDYTERKKFFLKDKVFNLGFSRLAIQDLNTKSNKIFYTNDYLLLFNGEIYNQKLLKNKYLNDSSFETSTDTEVLFNLLSKDQDNRSPLFWEMMKPFPLLILYEKLVWRLELVCSTFLYKSFKKSSFGGWSWLGALSFSNPLREACVEAGASLKHFPLHIL